MKTVREVIDTPGSGWSEDEHGIAKVIGKVIDDEFKPEIEVRIEPLLWGAAHLAVYIDGSLSGEKLPITLGTPAHNGVKHESIAIGAAALSPQPDYKSALADMVFQFAYRSTKDGVECIHTGGLSALEEAFETLGYTDPMPVNKIYIT